MPDFFLSRAMSRTSRSAGSYPWWNSDLLLGSDAAHVSSPDGARDEALGGIPEGVRRVEGGLDRRAVGSELQRVQVDFEAPTIPQPPTVTASVPASRNRAGTDRTSAPDIIVGKA